MHSLVPLLLILVVPASEGKLVVKRVGEDLTAVPTDIDPAVTTLILNKNKITRIKEEYLSSFLLLEKLQMEKNGINYINVRAFEKNKKLISFKFLNHRLAIFPLRIGGAWRSIVEIVGSIGLNRNMKSVQFANLPALRKLSFNSNKVVNLTLGDLPSLRELHFRYCKLEIFPNLTGAPNLREVYVNENAIKQIPRLLSTVWLSCANSEFPIIASTICPISPIWCPWKNSPSTITLWRHCQTFMFCRR